MNPAGGSRFRHAGRDLHGDFIVFWVLGSDGPRRPAVNLPQRLDCIDIDAAPDQNERQPEHPDEAATMSTDETIGGYR